MFGVDGNRCCPIALFVRYTNNKYYFGIINILTSVPCNVPSTEHGSYLTIAGPDHPEVTRHSANTKLLTAFEEIHNGDIIDFQCDEGYNIQGSNQLKCWQGNWDVNNLPECLAAPCVLPTISNAVYQVNFFVFFFASNRFNKIFSGRLSRWSDYRSR